MIGKSMFCDAVRARLYDEHGMANVGREHFTAADALLPPSGYAFRFKTRMVSDRGHMSGLVYGDVVRGKPDHTPEEYRLIDGLMLAAGGMMVLLTATPAWYEDLVNQHSHRDGELYDRTTNLAVAQVFAQLGLGKGWMGIRPVIDVWLHCGIGQYPSANTELVDQVAARYATLQEALA